MFVSRPFVYTYSALIYLPFTAFSMDLRTILIIFLLPYAFLSDARQEKHFLRYEFTAFFKPSTFTAFKAVGVCDHRQIAHYSNDERVWIRSSVNNWINAPEAPPDSRDWFLHQLNSLSNCTDSQCFEPHVLQRVIGCELEKSPEGTVSLRAFDEYGFDGEDFMFFNSDTQQWIDKNLKAKETKMKWDQQTERNKLLHHYLKTCMNWISSFNNTKKNSPVVRVFARKAPDDHSKLNLICLATGFYPRDIEMNIRLDESVLVNQTSSGIRPNDDGSFQMRTSVKIDANHNGIYDCLVKHSNLTQARPIKTVYHQILSAESQQWSLIMGIKVTAAVVIFLLLIGYCIYRKIQML
ncbi:major histocompatibility complex class I-related gene protein-like isoform X1 [Carassius auratus]|uniref:Major histocompatibility complex class I-related gene protein-like isoform X1 n=1 Tax=Carassius auratus TaxID=7957 RepID=A0A6P6LXP0_CARAU|nr:major histocompatibility complex class I-related gene protein-like isoform X1 [Carassius auratus]